MKESYLACGNPDHCTDKVIFGVAMPKIFNSQTCLSYILVLLYGWSLIVIISIFMGYWWTQPYKTKKGLNQKTANCFFTFAFGKKSVSFSELIQLFCETEEIYQEVEAVQLKLHGIIFQHHFQTVSFQF